MQLTNTTNPRDTPEPTPLFIFTCNKQQASRKLLQEDNTLKRDEMTLVLWSQRYFFWLLENTAAKLGSCLRSAHTAATRVDEVATDATVLLEK